MADVSMERREWHTLNGEEVIRTLGSGPQGLDRNEAKRRLEEYGPNLLTEEVRAAPLRIFFQQFKNLLVIILIAAVVVSAAIGEVFDAGVIFALVMACAVLGFVQEHRSQKAIEALKKMATPRATVIRNGQEENVPTRERGSWSCC